MNPTNDFVTTMINNREKLVDKLVQNYSYNHLLKIFQEVNSEADPSIQIKPSNRFLYRILTGKYVCSSYTMSSIDWMPTEELVDAIIDTAKAFKITHIEEMYSGSGLLSSLLQRKNQIKCITAADTFEDINTCNKLDFIPIAKRSISDYQYYSQLSEPHPEMVIINRYPPDTNKDGKTENSFITEVMDLVNRNNNKVIMLILPITYTNFYQIFYHLANSGQYSISSYYIKALSKNFYLENLLKDQYKSFMVAHILVNNYSIGIPNIKIDTLFSRAIIPSTMIDQNCPLVKSLTTIYPVVSSKLIRNICKKYDYLSHPNTPTKRKINEIYRFVKDEDGIKDNCIPQFIYEIDEMTQWMDFFLEDYLFAFENRQQFHQFYVISCAIRDGKKTDITFPKWANNFRKKYIYAYLLSIDEEPTMKNYMIISDRNEEAMLKPDSR